MAKKARKPIKFKKAKKAETVTSAPKLKTVSISKVEEVDLEEIREERDRLIKNISKNLLTKSQMKRGGPGIRVRYEKELGSGGVLEEINKLGRQLSMKPIGLGNLRKD